MGEVSQYQLQSTGPERVIVAGTFTADGATITYVTPHRDWSVARTATGVYTVTFSQRFAAAVVHVTFYSADLGAYPDSLLNLACSTVTPSSRTAALLVTEEGAPTAPVDLPADGGLSFVAVLFTSSADV